MSFQQVIIVGNLGRDPEMRYTPSGVPNTRFSVAVSRQWTNQEGQKQEKTVWFNVTAWRKLAEFAGQYLTKGQSVLIVGEVEEPRVWQDKEGNHRASLDVTAQTIRFAGPRPEGAGSGSSASGDSYEGSGGDDYGSRGGYSGGAGTVRPANSGGARDAGRQEPEDIPF